MAARKWTCRGCKAVNARTKPKCPYCGRVRPKARPPAHRAVLSVPYEVWAAEFGDRCNICGAEGVTRRLHRDHDHASGLARGILCFRCNTLLPNRADGDWLRRAADYVDRTGKDLASER
jgi:hypothetical protein